MFALFALSISCRAEVFRVAMVVIPVFNPITNQQNSANYIGLHLYYPLFKQNSLGDLESVFLNLEKTKAIDDKFSEYTFCLRDNLKFSDKTPISSKDFLASLKYFSEMYEHALPLKSIAIKDHLCISVSLRVPTPNLFRRLTGMASTILKADQVTANYPVGYGPYVIKEKSDKILVLNYIGEDQPRFDNIEFRLVKSITDTSDVNFHDINQLPPSQRATIGDNFVTINAPTLKVYTLVINLPSLKQRKNIQCALKTINWTDVYGLDLIPQKKFLPIIRDVNEKQIPVSAKDNICKNIEKPVTMLVVNLYDKRRVIDALKKAKIDKKFDIVSLDTTQFAEWIFSGKPYVALIAFDSSGSISSLDGDFSVYFESFFTRKNRIVTTPIQAIEKNIELSFQPSRTLNERMIFMRKSEDYLLDNAYIVPLGRVNRFFHFPKNIEVVSWADFFSGFVEINRIK
ncbi:MAG TPA: ABC transporter substrate-binding protein [Bacteroidales bacterium]